MSRSDTLILVVVVYSMLLGVPVFAVIGAGLAWCVRVVAGVFGSVVERDV